MYTKLMLPFLCLIVMNLNGLEAMHLHNGKSDADSVAASMKLKGSESVRTLSNNPETAGAKNLPRNINQPINAGQVSRDIGSRISDSTISANSDNTANTGAGIVTHSARNEEHIGIDGHKHVHVTVLSEHSGNAQAVVQKQVMKAGEMLTSEHTTKDDRKSNTSETLDNIRTLGIDKVERLGTDHANTDTTNNVQTSQINKVEKISTGVAKSASIDTKTGVSKSASIDKQSATTSKTNNDPDDVVYHDYLDDLHNDNHGNEDLYHEVDMTATTKSTSAHVSTAGATSSSTTTITRSPASPTPTSTASSTTTSTTTATSTTTTTSRPTTTSFATTTTADTTTISPSTEPKPEDDVDPLGIFVGDITFQRFPKPMAMTAFKDKV